MSLSDAECLASLPEAQRTEILAELTDAQHDELLWDWWFWARPSQKEPPGEWLTWLILAGRGFGKTKAGAETIRRWACGKTPLARGRYRRFLLIAETAADARDVMVEGESGILAVHPPDFRPLYEPSKRRLTWPNGAVASLFNATEPDQLRGPQGDAAWCDELAKWQYARETWDMLQFGLRLGDNPRQIVTTTPRPVPVVKELLAAPTTVVTRGATMENRGNLAPSFLRQITARYQGTRLGRQELEAEVLDDNPNALWTRAGLEQATIAKAKLPQLQRIVVAIDPSGSDGRSDDEADDIGIIACGHGIDGHMYVLHDATCNKSPAGWGLAAVNLYRDLKADVIVAERNYGGAMVEHVIRSVDPLVPYKEVVASRGKWLRAEPVAALYEQKRVHHVGAFPPLEDEMCAFGPDGLADGKSPNRLDALVWAATELMLGEDKGTAVPRAQWQLWEADKYPACNHILGVLSASYPQTVTIWGSFVDPKGLPKVMLLYGWTGHLASAELASALDAMCSLEGKGTVELKQLAKAMKITAVPRFKAARLILETDGKATAAQQQLGVALGSASFAIELVDNGRWGEPDDRMIGVQHLFADGAVYAPRRAFANRVIDSVAEYPNGQVGLANTATIALLYMRDIGLLRRAEEHTREQTEAATWRGREKSLYPG